MGEGLGGSRGERSRCSSKREMDQVDPCVQQLVDELLKDEIGIIF